MAALEHEMRAEQAASLGRLGRQIEHKIAELHEHRERLANCRGSERIALIEKCLALHEEAERYLWYMRVQREAIGLYNHDDLPLHYPIPKALP